MITLTAIRQLIEDFEVFKVLVIAPKRVAEDTWSREHEKWDHLSDLKISKVLGSAAKRKASLEEPADIYIIGRDNVQWLVDYETHWPFDMIVIDELSSFKNPQSKRFKALRKVAFQSERLVGLTGTPSPNGLIDLWAQIFLMDHGKRLGRTLGAYRSTYFRAGAQNGFIVYRWDLRKGAKKQIREKIADLCISMSASDYLELPERIDNVISVQLSDREAKLYKQMETEQLLEINDENIVALNAAAVMNKLLQLSNGAAYTDKDTVAWIHDRKIEALEEIIDTTDSPVLVFYSFRHDLERIRVKIKDTRTLDTSDDIKDWNDGKIKVLLAHPASVGYGLNLQDGGHVIVWFGLTWSLELYQQANARLFRQGQTKTVIIHHLLTAGTVDEQVMTALQKKDTSQRALLDALKERKEG